MGPDMVMLKMINTLHVFSLKGSQGSLDASNQWLGATVASGGPDGALVVSVLKSCQRLSPSFF